MDQIGRISAGSGRTPGWWALQTSHRRETCRSR